MLVHGRPRQPFRFFILPHPLCPTTRQERAWWARSACSRLCFRPLRWWCRRPRGRTPHQRPSGLHRGGCGGEHRGAARPGPQLAECAVQGGRALRAAVSLLRDDDGGGCLPVPQLPLAHTCHVACPGLQPSDQLITSRALVRIRRRSSTRSPTSVARWHAPSRPTARSRSRL